MASFKLQIEDRFRADIKYPVRSTHPVSTGSQDYNIPILLGAAFFLIGAIVMFVYKVFWYLAVQTCHQ